MATLAVAPGGIRPGRTAAVRPGQSLRMSYRLHSDEAPSAGFRRIVFEELDAARDELLAARDAAAALHEVRKRIKKLRALLALARPALGERADEEDERLREVARSLAQFRANDALQALLRAEAGQAGAAETGALVAAVNLHQVAATGLGDRGRELARARRALGGMRRRFARAAFDPLAPGACRRRLRKRYKRARKDFVVVRATASEDGLHRWRRSAKLLLNQVRLLRGWGGGRLPSILRGFEELDNRLGRARDCDFLAGILRGVPAAETPLRNGFGLRARLEGISRGEVARALRLGRRLFRLNSRAFVERLFS